MMKCEPRRSCRVWRWTRRLAKAAVVLTLIAAPAAWFGIPRAAKTAWARERAERALTRTLGTRVSVGSMRFSWKDGLEIRNVSADPAVYGRAEVAARAGEIRLKPDWKRLLSRRLSTRATLVEPRVSIREMAEAASTPAIFKQPCIAKRGFDLRSVRIEKGAFSFESSTFEQRVILEDVNLSAQAALRRGRIDLEVSKVDANLNGGKVTASGLLAAGAGDARVRVEFSGTSVESGDLFARALRHAVPLFETMPSGSVRGRMDVRFKAEGHAKDLPAVLRAAQGAGGFIIRDAELRGSRLLYAAGPALFQPGLGEARFHEAEGLFTIHEGQVHTSALEAHAPEGTVSFMGNVSVNGAIDYYVTLGDWSVRVTGTLASPRAGSQEH